MPRCSHLEIGANNNTDRTVLLSDLNKRIKLCKEIRKGAGTQQTVTDEWPLFLKGPSAVACFPFHWPVSSQSFWPRSLVFAKVGVCEEKLSSGDRKVGDGDAGRSPWEESLLCSLDSQP